MVMEQIMECVIPFIAGAIGSGIVLKAKTAGDMVINTSDPEKDIYSLELNVPPEKFQRCRYVKFRVKKSGGVPHNNQAL